MKVENQLGKTIKALRSDREGGYISQEFTDYLKACRIIQQLTPPYTLQHNGVSERRNRTFLDMVRSIMNLTTLQLSFWDYSNETATRIFNMVPTKKALVKRDTLDKLQQISVRIPEGNYSVKAKELKEIQDKDTLPSENTSEIPIEVEGFEPPQVEVVPIHRHLNGGILKFCDPIIQKSMHKASNSFRLDLNKTQGATTPREVKRMQNVPYDSVVGSIMYANPGEPHWTAVKTILKYLEFILKICFLGYGGNPDALTLSLIYYDAGFETDRDDIKSQT
ncbi:retrotransposon protein, putative, ty1-copia subclass [Tanacetum coccineum]